MPHESLHLGMFPLAAHCECWEICELWFPAESGTGNDEYQQKKYHRALKFIKTLQCPKAYGNTLHIYTSSCSLGVIQESQNCITTNIAKKKRTKMYTSVRFGLYQKFGESLFYYTFIFIFLKSILCSPKLLSKYSKKSSQY